MKHCVGSYDCDVVDEKTKIYSLRDPGNKPHVTMEVEVESWDFKQIHGKSNSEPKSEYKKMIGEWMKTLKNVVIGKYEINDFDYDALRYEEKEDIPDALHNAIFKYDDYGIVTNLTNFVFDDAYRSIVSSLNRYWLSDLTSVLDRIAEPLVMATVEKERGLIIFFKKDMERSNKYSGKRKYSEKTIAANINNATIRFSESNDVKSKIKEESERLDDEVLEDSLRDAFRIVNAFGAEELGQEEFERRVEQHLEEQKKYKREKYIQEDIEYAFANALHKELENYLKKNPLPTY